MSVQTPHRVELTVTGMTCEHCALSVTEEISEIDGVTMVDVALEGGAVTVIADRDVSIEEIAAAVTEAGFGVDA